MPSIKDNLNAIKAEITEISKIAKSASDNTKTIGENLKFDPTNVRLVADRFKALGEELKVNNELVAKYKKAVADLSTMRAGLDPKAKQYADDYNKLTKAINRYETAIKSTELKVKSLTTATDKHVQQQALVRAATEATKQKFEKLEKATKTLSVAMLALVAIVAKMATAAMEQGRELYTLSKRYNTTAEDLQTWNRALQLATGEADLFTNSISTMVKGMSQIVSGRGVAYTTALRKIGLAYKDLAELDTEEQFRAIVNGLAGVTNETDRLSIAQQLLGESGQSIARVLREGTDELEKRIEDASKFGIITQQNAEALNDMSLKLEAAKSQISLASAELIVALTPALLTLADILTNTIAPILKTGADILDSLGEGGQKVLLGLIVVIAVLPKLVAGIQAVTAAVSMAKVGVSALNIATANWQPILLAVAAAITIIISLIAIFSKKAKDAQKQFDSLVNTANTLSDNAIEYSGNVQSTSTSMTERTLNVQVEVDGHGDTPISDENAMKISQLTVDELSKRLQKDWGDLIG